MAMSALTFGLAPWRVVLFIALLSVGLALSFTVFADAGSKATIWRIIYWYGAALILTSPLALDAQSFFMGLSLSSWIQGMTATCKSVAIPRSVASVVSKVDQAKAIPRDPEVRKAVGFWTLMPSAFITWIFAKSIYNAAVLGGKFGLLGGFGYASWYLSFWTAALVGYMLRTRHGQGSLPGALNKAFGPVASFCFGVALLFRLWNEVWSNATVVANFYGEPLSSEWWGAVVLSTGVPLTYVLLGGMYSSLISDAMQALLGVFFLIFILCVVGSRMDGGLGSLYSYEPSGGWLEGGWELLGTGALQGLTSYPFMDPVLTDRTFLSTPRTMALSFFVGGIVSMAFIVLFSSIGLFGTVLASEAGNGSPVVVATYLGEPAHSLIVLVMMTSSLSTLDSTFTSVGKMFALDVAGWAKLKGDTRKRRGPLAPTDTEHIGSRHVLVARVSMVVLGISGCLYLLASSDVLSATTVSGTVVMGLAPPIFLSLFWKYNSAPDKEDGWRQSPLAFALPFICGVTFGFCYQNKVEIFAHIGVGAYARLLGVNVYGTLVCFGACAFGFVVDQLLLPRCTPKTWHRRIDPELYLEDPKTGAFVQRPGGWTAGPVQRHDPEAASYVSSTSLSQA